MSPPTIIARNWAVILGAALLLLGNVLFAALFFHAQNETRSLGRANAELQTRNVRMTEQVRAAEDSRQELRKNIAAAIDSQELAGLYAWKNPSSNRYQELDLRSDGTGTFDNGNGTGRTKPATWQKDAEAATITISSLGKFKIENGDMIDPQGHRWLHIR